MKYKPCLQAVFDFMSDGRVHTIKEGVQATKLKADTFAAMLRELRKEKWGAHTVICQKAQAPAESQFRLIARSAP